MIEFLNQGGTVMYLILLCSVGALAVVIERVFSLVRVSRSEDAFQKEIADVMVKGGLSEAAELCDEHSTPSARICGAALVKQDCPRDEVREAAEDAGAHEVTRLSRHMVMLATVAQVAPLLGLLGTVLGMIETFARIKQSAGGLVDPELLSGGIQKALLTTAFGLSVAIPALVAHTAISSWIDRLVGRTEQISRAVVEVICGGSAGGGD